MNKYQCYSLAPSNQHSKYMCRQWVYMTCNMTDKHMNSFDRNIQLCKLQRKSSGVLNRTVSMITKAKLTFTN